jgi:hypothetical protein
VGQYANFFQLRVDTKQDEFLLYSVSGLITTRPVRLPVRAFRKLGRMLKVQRAGTAKQFRTGMQVCASCNGVTPCHEYFFEDLLGLYRDYREESYNRDRISVEPGYARMAAHVGAHPLEIKNRNAAVDGFLRRSASQFAGGVMIDYGGSDGRFIPAFAYEQFDSIDLYDASEAALHSSVDSRKVRKIPNAIPGAYSFLICMHVLEHVGNPRQFIIEAMRFLLPGGLMYVEVPLELNETLLENHKRNMIDTAITIHEHMNLFDRGSIRALVASIDGLEMVDDAEDVVDLGWTKGLMGRFLARKAK